MIHPRAVRSTATLLSILSLGVCLADETRSPAPAALLSATGLLNLFTGNTTCLQGDYDVSSPCGGPDVLLDSYGSSVPLGNYVCQFVSVSGPDVGIECQIIGVQSIAVVPPPPCQAALSVNDPVSTWLQWPVRPCATSYDVIRGLLPGPGANGGRIDLGPVVCLVNDIVFLAGSIPSTFNGPRDGEVPAPGQVFFYLERANLGSYGITEYGYSSAGEVEAPSSGDCAP